MSHHRKCWVCGSFLVKEKDRGQIKWIAYVCKNYLKEWHMIKAEEITKKRMAVNRRKKARKK